jgi:hypothetical protein
MRICELAMLLAGGVVFLHAERFPKVEGENLLGQKIALPDAAAGHRNQTKARTSRLRHEVPTYSIALFEDAPRLVPGMAVHGMS